MTYSFLSGRQLALIRKLGVWELRDRPFAGQENFSLAGPPPAGPAGKIDAVWQRICPQDARG